MRGKVRRATSGGECAAAVSTPCLFVCFGGEGGAVLHDVFCHVSWGRGNGTCYRVTARSQPAPPHARNLHTPPVCVCVSCDAAVVVHCARALCCAARRYDDYAFERIAESAFGRSARAGRLEQVTFLRMGDLMFDNWDAFSRFLNRMRCKIP